MGGLPCVPEMLGPRGKLGISALMLWGEVFVGTPPPCPVLSQDDQDDQNLVGRELLSCTKKNANPNRAILKGPWA